MAALLSECAADARSDVDFVKAIIEVDVEKLITRTSAVFAGKEREKKAAAAPPNRRLRNRTAQIEGAAYVSPTGPSKELEKGEESEKGSRKTELAKPDERSGRSAMARAATETEQRRPGRQEDPKSEVNVIQGQNEGRRRKRSAQEVFARTTEAKEKASIPPVIKIDFINEDAMDPVNAKNDIESKKGRKRKREDVEEEGENKESKTSRKPLQKAVEKVKKFVNEIVKPKGSLKRKRTDVEVSEGENIPTNDQAGDSSLHTGPDLADNNISCSDKTIGDLIIHETPSRSALESLEKSTPWISASKNKRRRLNDPETPIKLEAKQASSSVNTKEEDISESGGMVIECRAVQVRNPDEAVKRFRKQALCVLFYHIH